MTENLSFQGRVAIITGAGKGLGREYALFLASRGASVIVNDVIEDLAESTVKDIGAKGGSAIVYVGRIEDPATTHGINIPGAFSSAPTSTFDRLVDVNVRGPWNLTRAAWPYMEASGYGRVILLTSATVLGQLDMATYGMTRAAMWGLACCLAQEGAPLGIHVNALAPVATTAKAGPLLREKSNLRFDDLMELTKKSGHLTLPEYVPPVVAWLVHHDCNINGQCIEAAGRSAGLYVVAETRGYAPGPTTAWTPEIVRDHWKNIASEEGMTVRHSGIESLNYTADHLLSKLK